MTPVQIQAALAQRQFYTIDDTLHSIDRHCPAAFTAMQRLGFHRVVSYVASDARALLNNHDARACGCVL